MINYGYTSKYGRKLNVFYGENPSTLAVLPTNKAMAEYKLGANIMNNKPLVNIVPFGMCKSPVNPAVAAATAAVLRDLTPMPCTPVIPAPTAPGSAILMLANFLALDHSSKCMCAFAGVISITNPECTQVMVL